MGFQLKVIKNPEVLIKLNVAKNRTLEAAGQILVDQTATNTVPITGALRNSWHYKTSKVFSGFGDFPTTPDVKQLTLADQITAPKEDNVVVTGSNLIYAARYELRRGVLATASDVAIPSIRAAAVKIFNEEMQD